LIVVHLSLSANNHLFVQPSMNQLHLGWDGGTTGGQTLTAMLERLAGIGANEKCP
jgi:hypothetical protein